MSKSFFKFYFRFNIDYPRVNYTVGYSGITVCVTAKTRERRGHKGSGTEGGDDNSRWNRPLVTIAASLWQPVPLHPTSFSLLSLKIQNPHACVFAFLEEKCAVEMIKTRYCGRKTWAIIHQMLPTWTPLLSSFPWPSPLLAFSLGGAHHFSCYQHD